MSPPERGKRGEQPVVPRVELRSYYDRPILKAPAWQWYVPTYLFTGGVAGVSSLLALGGRVSGSQRLARQSRLVALAALSASTALLVADLGRPSRFYNMLRVFKPTSPMSMGSWLLSAYGLAAGGAAASDLLGVVPGAGLAADAAAAVLGPAVATYTAVLLADTAVPAWHEAYQELPFVFAGGAALSAAGLAIALGPPEVTGPARRALLGGAALEMSAMALLKRRLTPTLREPYQEGQAGRLGRLSLGMTATGSVAVLAGRRRPWLARVGGLAAVTGAALQRFSVFEAGKASTADPRYVVGPQRQHLAHPAS